MMSTRLAKGNKTPRKTEQKSVAIKKGQVNSAINIAEDHNLSP
jgi:hypothetical protein